MTNHWEDSAACRDAPVEWFFPDDQSGRRGGAHHDYSLAKSVCATCTVRSECLAEALDEGMDFGCWGGLTPTERKRLRRKAS